MHRARRGWRRLRRNFLIRLRHWFGPDGFNSSRGLHADGLGSLDLRHFGRLRLGVFALDVRRAVSAGQTPAKFENHVVIERARMRFLVRNAELGQQVQNDIGLDLQLASQLVDADFTHTVAPLRSFSASSVAMCLSSIRKSLMLPDAPCFLS
jgi:hypothetical protein